IEIVYANDISESKTILKFLDNTYTVIDYTAPNFNRKGYNEISNMRYGNTILNSHNVIGQEFDNVCLILGNEFFYDNDGFLRANDVNDQLDLMKLLYQNVTRTKHKLVLVVNRNKELYIDLLTILKPRIQKSIKLKEIENIGYNTIPNSKGVFYIFKHNNNILKNENTGEDINVKGNILYVESCKDLRKAIKSLITNIITKKLKKFEDIEIADLLNLKVSWIDSKNKEQIFSYIVEQHIEKYGEIPFLNIPLKLKGYSDNIIRNYSYIVEYD
ncbi:TPA: RNA helicase, partial [Staphylococcus aureus]|nr:RNA helicase [Staphylococcus aureus]